MGMTFYYYITSRDKRIIITLYMSSAEITIIKRDGKRKAFSVEKIKNAIRKAFLSVGAFATEEDLVNILSHVRITEGMHVEDIQNQVEIGLMAEQYFAVAKSFMLYRQRHSEDREVRDHPCSNHCRRERRILRRRSCG